MIVPRVSGNDAVAFLGVFDGTVGDHAAEYVHATIADNVCNSKVRARLWSLAGMS